MEDRGILQVRVSRAISAPKWKILRLITRVEDFPKYASSVKEASILEKNKNTFKTKWRIQVDEVPINWVEEDVLDPHKPKITFKATEGDLEQFEGTWNLFDHPEGTLVDVIVKIVVGIPAIQHFADPYIKNVIQKNFESILEAMENRLISVRYAGLKEGDKDKVAGFGVIGHFYNYNHLMRCLKAMKPDFKVPSQEFISKLFDLTPSFKIYEMKNFTSKTGDTTDGNFILSTFIPDMVDFNAEAVYSKVVRACKVAEKYGVGIVTLGGFSSVVGERYGQKIGRSVDIPITTGNTLTSSLAIDGVSKASELMGIDLKKAKVAIVGGTGDIGSACARALAKKVRRVVVTGRTKSNLRKMWWQLKFKYGARGAEATTDNVKAVRDADIVLACASVSSSILDINVFKPGAIICDLAYPKNISYMATGRKDILIFSGGLAKLPSPINVGFDTGSPSPDISYGCFSEVIVLALEKRYENFSFGRGNITPDKIEEMRQMATKHGFEVAPFYWGDKLIDEGRIAEIRKNVKT